MPGAGADEAAGTAQPTEPVWAVHQSTDGRLAVELPGVPVVTTVTASSELGPLDYDVATVLVDGVEYTVADAARPAGQEADLPAAASAMGVSVLAESTFTAATELELGGVACLRFEAEGALDNGPGALAGLVCDSGDHVYQLYALGPAGALGHADRFLSSAAITG